MRFPANLDKLPQMMELIREQLKQAHFEPKEVSHIELAAEEALVNVINYAYPDGEGEVEISCHIIGNKQIEIEIQDWGIEFDPTSQVRQLDMFAPLEEREVGGLGVYFMFQMMDDIQYTRKNNSNILKLSKRPVS